MEHFPPLYLVQSSPDTEVHYTEHLWESRVRTRTCVVLQQWCHTNERHQIKESPWRRIALVKWTVQIPPTARLYNAGNCRSRKYHYYVILQDFKINIQTNGLLFQFGHNNSLVQYGREEGFKRSVNDEKGCDEHNYWKSKIHVTSWWFVCSWHNEVTGNFVMLKRVKNVTPTVNFWRQIWRC